MVDYIAITFLCSGGFKYTALPKSHGTNTVRSTGPVVFKFVFFSPRFLVGKMLQFDLRNH